MDYMLLIYDEERGEGPDGEVMELCGGLVERLAAKGQYRSAGVLQPTAAASTLRMREGQRMVIDGPFAETCEQLAGYLVVRAEASKRPSPSPPSIRSPEPEVWKSVPCTGRPTFNF